MEKIKRRFTRRFEPPEVKRERLLRKWTRLLVELEDTRRELARLEGKDGKDEK